MIYRIININKPEYTEDLYDEVYNRMPPARQEKADRYKLLEDKRACVFSYMLLCDLLKEEFNERTPQLYLNEKGKPCLKGERLHFSISHSGDFIACAVDTKPVGIDIEIPRDVYKRVISHSCTGEEVSFIHPNLSSLCDPLPANSPEALRFLTLWTAKEAYLKYTGDGIGGGLKSVIVAESGELKTRIDNKNLISEAGEDYVLSILSENN